MKDKTSSCLMRLTIQDILEWIEFNLAEELTLRVLEEKTGYSQWHFQKSFKEVTGMSPGVYIKNRKMAIASDLLTETNSSITEIAMYLGYRQQSAFCRSFRQHYHLTPRQYRLKSRT